MTTRLVPDTRPAIAWSLDSGIAALILEPWTRDLADAEKRAILAAKRVRIFIDNRAHPSRSVGERVNVEQYPLATLRWSVDLATSILPGVFDCRKASRSEELEALLQKFDTPDVEDEFCVIHLLADSHSDVDNLPVGRRDYEPFCAMTSPSAANEKTDQITGDPAKTN
jgi:hypothetical protein